jgi:hypothetical protein
MQTNFSQEVVPKIRVVVRKRPLNSKEVSRNEKEVVKIRSERALTVEENK